MRLISLHFKFRLFIVIILFLIILNCQFLNLKIEKHLDNSHSNITEEKPMSSYIELFGLGGIKLGTRDGEYPTICRDNESGAIICWRSGRIYAQKINYSGDLQWIESGIPISQSLNYFGYPDICKDDNGGAIIVWHGAETTDDYNIYAQKINSTGHLQWSVKSICSALGVQATPKICRDGTGGAIIIWRDYRTVSSPQYCDIYAQRVNSSGNIQWDHNGILISDTKSYMDTKYKIAKIMSDNEGGAIISWEDLGNIYAQKINSSGDIQWTPNGLAVCEAEGPQENPTMCSDSLGGAFFAWVDKRPPYNLDEDIYAQRVNSTGNFQWSVNGKPIISKENYQHHVKICEDGSGNAILIWMESFDILVSQKMDLDGNLLWGSQGIVLGEITSTPPLTQICIDGTGGFLIAWRSTFNNSPSIYIQHIDSNGIFNWYDGGLKLRTISYFRSLYLTGDDKGGCIMVWEDYRIDKYEISVEMIKNKDSKPYSNNPLDINTTSPALEEICWTLRDDYGGGQYRILIYDSEGSIIEWVNWTGWEDNETVRINPNDFSPGIYFYTIEFFDSQRQLGLNNTVIVHIEPPQPPQPIVPSPSILGYEFITLIGISITVIFILTIRKYKEELT